MKPKVLLNKNSKSKIIVSDNSSVINEAYEGLDAKDFPSPPEEKEVAKPKPVVKKKVLLKKKVEKKEEKPDSPVDPGEAEALKLYNEALAKGINPADIGTDAGNIVLGSEKKSQKPIEVEPEVKEFPKEAPQKDEKN